MQRKILSLVFLVLACGLPTLAAEHPVKLDKDADCATCHEEKTKGKAVHSAIAMGCTTCHDVKTEGETTTVNLTAPKEELCFTCHEKSKDEVKHPPYDKGQCVTCHDPHTSDYPKQLRAEYNALCLECHADRRVSGDTVTLFKSRSMPAADFASVPKIVPNAAIKAGHPFAGHPIADIPDPLNHNEKMTCLTCHQPHSSEVDKLGRIVKPPQDVCDTCHQAVEKRRADAGATTTAAQEKQRQDTLKRMNKDAPLYSKPTTTEPKQ